MKIVGKHVSSVAKDQGKSFWQPNGKGSYIEIKASKWYFPDAGQLVFMHEVLPGGAVGKHQHERQEEILIGLSGHGEVVLDNEILEILPETVIQMLPKTRRSIRVIGDKPLFYMVIVNTCGLEDRLKQMGKERTVGEAHQIPFAFIRFPGLVANKKLIRKIRKYGLIPLGADAWLAKNKKPTNGSIILVHGNSNEHRGIKMVMPILQKIGDGYLLIDR